MKKYKLNKDNETTFDNISFMPRQNLSFCPLEQKLILKYDKEFLKQSTNESLTAESHAIIGLRLEGYMEI